MYVEEKNRSWCSSSNANDQRAVTIECASDTKHPYTMNSTVYATLIKLCVDICKRNGKKKLIWFGDKNKTLNYSPKSDEMVLTVHRWFANKSCPGDWLYSRLGDLASKVTAQLGGSSSGGTTASGLYRVRKSWNDAKSQKSLINAAKEAGFKMNHASVKRMLSNKKYLGTDYYPQIIDEETQTKFLEELTRRAGNLGRLDRRCKEHNKTVPTAFHFKPADLTFPDPFEQAEYIYSLIESEE